MKRCITAAAVVLALAGAAHESVAQVRAGGGRRGGGANQQPGATQVARPAPSPAPSTDSRFSSTLTFVPPPPPDVRPLVFPSAALLGRGPFGVGTFWPWGAWLPVAVYAAPPAPVLEPPLNNAPLGGLQLDIDPRRAQVYVDGVYAGLVEEFSGYFRHLDVPAGPHVIAVVAPDYEPLVLQLIVTPGATTMHRATLTRAYGR